MLTDRASSCDMSSSVGTGENMDLRLRKMDYVVVFVMAICFLIACCALHSLSSSETNAEISNLWMIASWVVGWIGVLMLLYTCTTLLVPLCLIKSVRRIAHHGVMC